MLHITYSFRLFKKNTGLLTECIITKKKSCIKSIII